MRKNQTKSDWLAYGIITVISFTVTICGPMLSKTVDFGPPAEEKPYDSFESFYPFYLSQHENETCRRLHFIGTSLVILFALYEHKVGLALLPAGLLGFGLVPLLMDNSHGLFEMAAVVLSFLLSVYSLTGSVRNGVICLSIGYSFAWIGHFGFEMNKPATFIYPTYSLLGDFKLWFEIATGAKPF
jgi:hypothetical protein